MGIAPALAPDIPGAIPGIPIPAIPMPVIAIPARSVIVALFILGPQIPIQTGPPRPLHGPDYRRAAAGVNGNRKRICRSKGRNGAHLSLHCDDSPKKTLADC